MQDTERLETASRASVPCSVRQGELNLFVLTLFREGILCSFVHFAELITELAEHANFLCCCLYGWRVKIASSIQSNKSVILITQYEVYCWYLDNRLLCACEQDPKHSQLTCFAFLPIFFFFCLTEIFWSGKRECLCNKRTKEPDLSEIKPQQVHGNRWSSLHWWVRGLKSSSLGITQTEGVRHRH